MKVAVMGAGGIGAYYGGMLAKKGEDVALIARGEHLAALRAHGLRVNSVVGDFQVQTRATEDPAEVGPVDLILFCVKSYDTEAAARQLAPLMAPGTVVISLQNGVDNEEKIGAVVGRERVMGGVAYIFSTIEAPGLINQTSGPRKIVFGELTPGVTPRGEKLLAAFRAAGINAELAADVRVALWEKFVGICGVGGVTALTRLSVAELLAHAETRDLLRGVMVEVEAVARALEIPVAPDIVDRMMVYCRGLEPGARSSLYHDLVNGKRLEVEAINGTAVRYGRDLGIATPLNFAIFAALKPYDEMARRARPSPRGEKGGSQGEARG